MRFVFYPLFVPLLVLALPLFSKRDLVGLFGNDPTTQSRTTLLDEPALTVTKPRSSTIPHIINPDTIISDSWFSPTSTISLPSSTTTTAGFIITTASSLGLVTPTQTSHPPETPPTSAEETTQWKVIGIGIITVGLIATAILSIVFFDSWWNFLCDLGGCRRRRKQGEECMVPDWDKRDWEFQLASEESHRYPTMLSLPGNTPKDDEAKNNPTDVKLPRPAFMKEH